MYFPDIKSVKIIITGLTVRRGQTLRCHSLSRWVKTPSWLSFEILQPGTISTSPTSGRNQEKEYSRAWRGRDQWNSKLKLFSANGSLSASVLCLKLPQTMTSNNHREAGPARVKRIENVTNGWTFQDDFSRWLAEIEDTPGVSASRWQQSRTFVGSWATIRKPGSERIVEFYSKQKKMTERMKLSAGQWNYNLL